MFSSVTRLRVRSIRFLPSFVWYTFQTQRQVERAPGFVGGRLLVDSKNTFWTLTVWESEKAMKTFRGAGTHARVMSRLPKWCDEAAYAHWSPQDNAIPEWTEAHQQLIAEGRLSRVDHPAPSHTDRQFPSPRLSPLIGGDIKIKNGSNSQRS
jgi:Domain of unknown function (DUF3291)